MLQSLRVVVPPAVEPVSLALARQHARIDTDYDDLVLANCLATARDLAETYLSRALITQTLSYTVVDTPIAGARTPLAPQLQVFPLSLSWMALQRQPLELPRSPVQSIVSLTTIASDGTATLVPSTLYDVLAGTEPGCVRLRQATGPGSGITVQFVAGYGATSDQVPVSIRQAVLFLTSWLYENRGDGGGDWPMAVRHLLAPYRLVTFGG